MIQGLTNRLIIFLRSIALVLVLLASALPSAAQDEASQTQQSTGIVATQQAVLGQLAKRTDVVDERIDASADSDEKLVELRLGLEDIATELLQSGVAFRPRLAEINSRLEQLGAPPADGQPAESEIVANERKALQAEKADINVLLGKAEDLSIRVSDLLDTIATRRSDLFRRQLTARYDLVDAFGAKTAADAQQEAGQFYRAISSWLRFVFQFKFQAVLAATFLALLAAAVLMVGGRRLVGRLIEPDRKVGDPSYLSRLSVAFWSTLLPTAALAVFFAATAFFFNYFNVLRGDIGIFLRSLSQVILIVFCVNRLVRAGLSPSSPSWRLIEVEPKPARWLIGMATAMAVMLGASVFLSEVNEQMGSPLSLTIVRSFVATVAVGILIILIGLVKPFRSKDGRWRPWPGWLRALLFAIGGFTVLTSLLGYIGMALFVSIQVVVTGTVLLLAYIGFLSAREISQEGAFADTVFGRRLAARGHMSDATLDQLGLVLGMAINLLIIAIFVPLALLIWGFQPGDLRAWVYKLATGIQIGSITISITGILTGLIVFVVGYFLTRWFQGWLDGSVMARGRVDAGVRNSIRTVVGYAGFAIAALVGISAAGLDLSNLALIAGGLSLGIGFGLQNVVSNFVSGLILLAERPFKAGDWIVAGDVSGTVKKISVRATEIETFQRQTMIMPNSLLINAAVGNWTHRNRLGRVDIKVNVAYGCDATKAHEVMLAIARSHPMVLKNPEPFVLFANFGPAALEFEIRVFLADILNGGTVQNDIRFQVLTAFERNGVVIPSTPRAEVNHMDPHAEERATAPAKGGKP